MVNELLKSVLVMQSYKDASIDQTGEGPGETADNHHEEHVKQSISQPIKNQKLVDRVSLYACTEDQASSLDITQFQCYLKLKNFKDVPSLSPEARPDHSQLNSIE